MKRFIKRHITKKQDTDYVDGGVIKRLDSNAPKTINCTKPVDFECTFSTLALANNAHIERSVFTLKAKAKNGTVNGVYKSRNEAFEFSAPLSFMDELQSVVAEYDFAQFNGITYRVSGLPDMYGATISINYESGEHIYSSNNQDRFIPLEAIEKLIELFKKHK